MKFIQITLFFILCVHIVRVEGSNKNPFEVLNLPKSATDQQIKNRFRELTKKYHPDKNPDPKAKDIYSEITNAYQTLSDPNQRKKYEQTLENSRNQNSFYQNSWNI